MHVILCLVKDLVSMRSVFLGSQLRVVAIVSLRPHCSTNTNASMAASLWADDVSIVQTYDFYTC